MMNKSSFPLHRSRKGFTLFEVLVALAVFSFAIGGLAIALESMAQAALEARERVLSRLQLESRLAYNLVDPPLEGDRKIKANEVTTIESMEPVDLTNDQSQKVLGIYRLKITSQCKKTKDSAEILLYRP
jgi:prepilin-type N-terminal cleavage/methylation domain-containing protein